MSIFYDIKTGNLVANFSGSPFKYFHTMSEFFESIITQKSTVTTTLIITTVTTDEILPFKI